MCDSKNIKTYIYYSVLYIKHIIPDVYTSDKLPLAGGIEPAAWSGYS